MGLSAGRDAHDPAQPTAHTSYDDVGGRVGQALLVVPMCDAGAVSIEGPEGEPGLGPLGEVRGQPFFPAPKAPNGTPSPRVRPACRPLQGEQQAARQTENFPVPPPRARRGRLPTVRQRLPMGSSRPTTSRPRSRCSAASRGINPVRTPPGGQGAASRSVPGLQHRQQRAERHGSRANTPLNCGFAGSDWPNEFRRRRDRQLRRGLVEVPVDASAVRPPWSAAKG